MKNNEARVHTRFGVGTIVGLAIFLQTWSCLADVTLAHLFSEHAVLQRDRPLPIWGWASQGETIEVTFGNERARTEAGPDGKWMVELAAQPMSAKPLTLTVMGQSTLTINDILLGDVWLCSGQSNMEFPLNNCNAESDIQAAEFPLIRQFGVPYHFAQSPQTDVEGQWQVCNPQTAPGFTAVGFYFARKVQQQTGVPIGILRSCVGGTNIECWMCQETLLGTPELAPFAQIMRDSLAQYQNELATALPEIEAWAARSRAALNSQTDIPLPPVWPEFPFGEKRFRPRCVTLHNGMIAPLVPMALKGILWYQGESNAGNAFDCEQYIVKQRTMVADWRRWFRNEELPFYFVQLATFQQPTDDPIQVDSWALFREAQRKCLEIPNSGMAVIYDLGDANDIHPQNKYDVGERLARWALSNQYGKELETSGPLFRELKIEGATARLAFEHVGSGLMVGKKNGRENTVEDKDNSLKRFAIAGEDRQWHWAAAKIEGDFIVCSSAEVQKPVAIRYAFSTNPEGANLYNRDGLPGSPFRTDDW